MHLGWIVKVERRARIIIFKDFPTGTIQLAYAVKSQIEMISKADKDHYQDIGAAFAQLLERTNC